MDHSGGRTRAFTQINKAVKERVSRTEERIATVFHDIQQLYESVRPHSKLLPREPLLVQIIDLPLKGYTARIQVHGLGGCPPAISSLVETLVAKVVTVARVGAVLAQVSCLITNSRGAFAQN